MKYELGNSSARSVLTRIETGSSDVEGRVFKNSNDWWLYLASTIHGPFETREDRVAAFDGSVDVTIDPEILYLAIRHMSLSIALALAARS